MRVWKPRLTFDAPGNSVIDCAGSVGTVERVGREASVSFMLQTVSYTLGTASGGVRITGLPYPAKGPAGAEWYGSLSCQGIADPVGAKLESRIMAGANYIIVLASGPGRSMANVGAAHMPVGPIYLRGTIQYGIEPWDTSPPLAVFIGDSTTWVRPLDNYRANTINAGLNGNTTAQMLARFQADVFDLSPAIVHIHGGVNDLDKTIDTMANLTAMASAARAAGVRVILATLPPVYWEGTSAPQNGGVDFWQGKLLTLNDKIRKLAANNDYLLADYYPAMLLRDGTQDRTLFTDTTHENELGSDVMWNVVEPLL